MSSFERRLHEALAANLPTTANTAAAVPDSESYEVTRAAALAAAKQADWATLVHALCEDDFQVLLNAALAREAMAAPDEVVPKEQELSVECKEERSGQVWPSRGDAKPMTPLVESLAQTLHKENFQYENGVLYKEGEEVELYTSSEEELDGVHDADMEAVPPQFSGNEDSDDEIGRTSADHGQREVCGVEFDDLDESIASCSTSFSASTTPATSPTVPAMRFPHDLPHGQQLELRHGTHKGEARDRPAPSVAAALRLEVPAPPPR